MAPRVLSSTFKAGSPGLQQLPVLPHPEIAIVGRSNVGKSTFINRVTGSSKLARTSSTPGRTQEINLFSIELGAKSGKSRSITLADLPGYGYAKFSKEKRRGMSKLNVQYLQGREQLVLVCLLNDIRRDPETDELAVRDLALEAGRELLVVITKVDKLSNSQRRERVSAITALYDAPQEQVLESGEGIPVDDFWREVLRCAG